jgi:hypothetical protein
MFLYSSVDVLTMRSLRNSLSFVLSVPAGILLLLKGISGPTGTYSWLIDYLNGVVADGFLLSVVTVVLLVLIVVSSLGGFAVLAGGFLIFKNHSWTGKLLISLGAGIGFFWVLFLLFALVSTGDLSSALSQYSLIGWSGLVLAFLSWFIAE